VVGSVDSSSPLNEVDVRGLLETIEAAAKSAPHREKRAPRRSGRER
jgi:hypothetical protein